MKKTHIIISLFVLVILTGCAKDSVAINLDTISEPKNISIATNITNDNSGNVTFTPSGEGVTQYEIYFGDDTATPAYLNPGETVTHKYTEALWRAKVVGVTLNGKKTEIEQDVLVTFRSPENLAVVIKSDPKISKKVNITATADLVLYYNVYFGEADQTDPIKFNIGETITYTYENAGKYTIRVVAKGDAIKTTDYTEDFEATLITNPTSSAPIPANRLRANVISIYSSKYVNVTGTNYFPDWGQGGQGSSWAEFNLNGDKMLQYINLSYQGIALANNVTIDVSKMLYLHLDVWTANVAQLETSLISKTNGEKPFSNNLTANQWTSIDIPISAFTNQGMTVADIYQLKFVGTPSAAGTVFIDNIYFYKN